MPCFKNVQCGPGCMLIVFQNTQVTETKEFRRSYFRESERKSDFKAAEFNIWCYRGQLKDPKWRDQDTANYTKLCTISVDLSHLPLAARSKAKGQSGSYYRLDYELVLLFGLTEMKAQVAWKERVLGKEVEQRSSTKIIYDPDTTNDDP